jgi:transcriptional regulator with XRE-family HTH domain
LAVEFTEDCFMIFGEKLRALREAAGMTQAQLALASGIPLGTIREYEQVKRDPLLLTAVKLAAGLGVSIEVFADCVNKDAERQRVARKPRGRPPKATPATPPAHGLEATAKKPRGRKHNPKETNQGKG